MQKGHVLIVDDEPSVCSALNRLLRSTVSDIYIANSAHEAIELTQKIRLDLVISDMKMPHVSGIDLLKNMRAISPETIQIIITGANEYSSMVTAINDCDLYGYIPKPWDPELVIHLVQQALELKNIKDEKKALYLQIQDKNLSLKRLNKTLKNEIKEKEYYSSMLKSEINSARNTQAKLIPENFCTNGYFTGFNFPARYLSGDFYDVIQLNKNEYIFCLGDVSGKGVNASLLMVKVSSLFRGFSKSNIPLNELMKLINNEVCNAMLGGMFITMILGKLNTTKNIIEIVNAGQLPILHIKKNSIEEYFAENIPVGIIPNEDYTLKKIDSANSKLFIYSDGLADRTDKYGKAWGFDRIKKLLIDNCALDKNNILQSISTELLLENAELEDDATVLMIDTT